LKSVSEAFKNVKTASLGGVSTPLLLAQVYQWVHFVSTWRRSSGTCSLCYLGKEEPSLSGRTRVVLLLSRKEDLLYFSKQV
ncbi:hypothetical protein J6590_044524, partial [Homalodisca vitripennis]